MKRAWNHRTCRSRGSAAVPPSVLTVDNHVDVFDIRHGHVVARFAFVAARLVPHDAAYVQVLVAIQWVCCKKKGEEETAEG